MRLKNTSRYETEEVRRLVAFGAKGVNLAGVAIHVKNSGRAHAGRAYYSVPCVSSAPASAKSLIVVRIGPPGRFPQTNMHTTVRWSGPWMTRAELQGLVHDGKSRVRMRTADTEDERARVADQGDRFLFQVGRESQHPYGGKRSPFIYYANWREALVGVAAHEARHIHQFRHRKRVSEVDCERFAFKALERYRAAQGATA